MTRSPRLTIFIAFMIFSLISIPRIRKFRRRFSRSWVSGFNSAFQAFVWTPFPLSSHRRGRTSLSRKSSTTCFEHSANFLHWRQGDAIILGRSQRSARNRYAILRQLRRKHANDVQLRGKSTPVSTRLATGDSRPLVKGDARQQNAGRPLRNGDSFCEITTNSISAGSPRNSAQASSRTSVLIQNMQLYNRGIRRRLAPMLQGDRRRLELAYSLMMTLPGTPVFRYGDEIGMGDNLTLPERNCARTPMQWSTEPNADSPKATSRACQSSAMDPMDFEHVECRSADDAIRHLFSTGWNA